MFGSFLNLFLLILHIGQTGSFPPPLSEKEEKELVEKMLKGDDSARSKLIEHNMRLVAHIVKKYYASAEDQNDLISIGSIGLIKGVDSYKPEKKVRLVTYAAKCVENEIRMHFRKKKRAANEQTFLLPYPAFAANNPMLLHDLLRRLLPANTESAHPSRSQHPVHGCPA